MTIFQMTDMQHLAGVMLFRLLRLHMSQQRHIRARKHWTSSPITGASFPGVFDNRMKIV
jgi:hypothetical protein